MGEAIKSSEFLHAINLDLNAIRELYKFHLVSRRRIPITSCPSWKFIQSLIQSFDDNDDQTLTGQVSHKHLLSKNWPLRGSAKRNCLFWLSAICSASVLMILFIHFDPNVVPFWSFLIHLGFLSHFDPISSTFGPFFSKLTAAPNQNKHKVLAT